MAKRGRPSDFKILDTEQLKFLILKGFTDKELCEFYKVAPHTLINYKKEHEDFFAPLKDWKIEADHYIEKSLYHRAKGYSHQAEKIFMTKEGEIVRAEYTEHYPPDPTSMIFWLKNRQPQTWRDKHEVLHSGELSLQGIMSHVQDATTKNHGRLAKVSSN